MSRRTARIAVAAATTLLTTLPVVALTATSASAGQPAGYGPSDPFDNALMGDTGPVEPMKNLARIDRNRYGYMLTAGQQNSHLTITLVNKGNSLRFVDTGTQRWKYLAPGCNAQRVRSGVAAVCKVPASTSRSNPALLVFHPRLGNDLIDGRTLPATFEMAVLCDEGNDTVFAGHGNDFVNGAQDVDHIHGGAGKDWIRGGTANDSIWGDDDNDYIVGQDGHDYLSGGAGANRIFQ
jgi:hypothetical protein